jgi:hypothetical protein
MNHWTTRILPHTDIEVGPCAWRLPMLAGPDKDYVASHPSLVVVDPSDDDALLEQAGHNMEGLPVSLGVTEPAFARQLKGRVLDRMRILGRDRLDALVLHVDDPAEIKSGGMLQTMFALRERGVVGCMGLAHRDPRVTEWLAKNAAIRLLGVSYTSGDQAAGYRSLPAAAEYGMSAYTLDCPEDDGAIRFALARSGRVLPVLDRPIPAGLGAMPDDEAESLWSDYKDEHPPPPALERGKPPVAAD